MTRLGNIARETGLYDYAEPIYGRLRIWQWNRAGRPIPPPGAQKRNTLIKYAERYSISILVETGTYQGDTLRAVRARFEQIYSIELMPDLYEAALRRCRRQANAQIILGDSGTVLPKLVTELSSPALFWLDAHYSGPGTADALEGEKAPIERELDAIMSSPLRHIIIIDDAREFHASATTGYPATSSIEGAARRNGYSFTELNDSFRLEPAEQQ